MADGGGMLAAHHEAVAEAELDIDYGGSPIVMGTSTMCLRRASASRIQSRSISRTGGAARCMGWLTAPATLHCSSVAHRFTLKRTGAS
jgi:hypothetical protein